MKKRTEFFALFLVFSMIIGSLSQSVSAFASDTDVFKENETAFAEIVSTPNEDNAENIVEETPEIVKKDESVENKEESIATEKRDVSAASNGTDLADWEYKEENGEIVLTKYIGTSKDVVIPGRLAGKPVAIDLSDYYNNKNSFFSPIGIETIVIGNEAEKVKLRKHISNRLFRYEDQLLSADLRGLDVSEVTDMSYMFYDCKSLTTLDISNWDTSNVTNMSHMFDSCNNLQAIDIINWDTTSVTDMRDMFFGCRNLTTLDVSNFDTSKVTDMSAVFSGCEKLQALDVSNWDTSSVTHMDAMFSGCRDLTTLDVSNFDTSNLLRMAYMFYDCKSLQTLDVSNWDTSKVTYTNYMFRGCESLTIIDVNNWDTSKVKSMAYMFSNCTSLTTIDVSNWNTTSVTDMSYMFEGCSSLLTVDVNNFDVSRNWVMICMFEHCDNMQVFDLSNWKFSEDLSMVNGMFYLETKVPTIIIAGDETRKKLAGTTGNRIPAGPKYDANGGTFDDGTTEKTYFDSIFVNNRADSQVTQKEVSNKFTPQKTGYTFEGWYLDKDFKTPYEANDTAVDLTSSKYMNDITLYAKYTPIDYVLKFDANTGKGTMNDVMYHVNDFVTLPENTFTKAGYTFTGWNTQADGQGTSYADGETLNVMPANSITLYAQWGVKNYIVKYDTGFDDVVITDKENVKWSDANLLPDTPKKDGYGFIGWELNGKEVLATDKYSDLAKNQTDGTFITLTAKWVELTDYSILYNPNGGSMPENTPSTLTGLKYADKVPALIPVREGYTFKGWKYNDKEVKENSLYKDLETDGDVKQIELVADWEINKYNVEYIFTSKDAPTDVKVPSKEIVEYNTTLTEPQFKEYKGWTFSGWYVDEALTQKFDFTTQIKADTKLYGAWDYKEEVKPVEPENPEKPDKPTPPSKGNENTSQKGNTPKTGDVSNMVLWLGVLATSGGLLLFIPLLRKRRQQKH